MESKGRVLVAMSGGIDSSVVAGIAAKKSRTRLHTFNVGFREQDIAYGSAMALVFFVLVLVLALVQRKLMEGKAA